MGVVKRQGIKGTIVVYGGFLLGAINNLLLFPKFLGADLFGLTRLLISICDVITQYANLGMPNTLVRFFPKFKDEQNQNRGILFFTLLIVLVGSAISILIYLGFEQSIREAYAEKSELFNSYFYWVIPMAFFIGIFRLFESYSRCYLKFVVPNIIRELGLRLMVTLLVGLFVLNLLDAHQFIVAFVLSYGIGLIALIIYLKAQGVFYLKKDFSEFTTERLKEMGKFTFFVSLNNTSGSLVKSIDILMLGALAGLTNTGVYSVALYATSFIDVPRKLLSQIALTLVAKSWNDNNLEEISKIYKQTTQIQLVVGLFIFLGIWFNIDTVVYFMPEDFKAIKYPLLFLGLAKVFNMGTGVNSEIIQNSPRYQINLYLSIITAVIAVITNYMLIPIYGITGAGISTAITILFINGMKYLFLKWKYKLEPYNFKTFILLLITGLVVGLNHFIPVLENPIFDSLLRTTVFVTTFGFLVYFLSISPDLNEVINKQLKKVGIHLNR